MREWRRVGCGACSLIGCLLIAWSSPGLSPLFHLPLPRSLCALRAVARREEALFREGMKQGARDALGRLDAELDRQVQAAYLRASLSDEDGRAKALQVELDRLTQTQFRWVLIGGGGGELVALQSRAVGSSWPICVTSGEASCLSPCATAAIRALPTHPTRASNPSQGALERTRMP